MKNVVVLGAGKVGAAMAVDLAPEFQVTAVDRDQDSLDNLARRGIAVKHADLADPQQLRDVVKGADYAIGAVPGFMGYVTLRTLIEEGIDTVDISFFGEDPFMLDALAKEKWVTAIVDCGVAPGMDNVLLGYHDKRMAVREFECLVGGLPVERSWPYEYKAPFSPIDVIEEYTRPARIVRDGVLVERQALSEIESLWFEGIGTLEAFNSDGLRSLLRTMPHIPNMIERTLRYPGHAGLMKVLRETGFFSSESLEIYGHKIRPIDLTARLLFPLWELRHGEEEFTVMRVRISGEDTGGHTKTILYELLDRYDPKTQTTSMARTTGYTCTGALRLLASGAFGRKGICPPEFLGEEKADLDFLLKHLADRGIYYRKSEA